MTRSIFSQLSLQVGNSTGEQEEGNVRDTLHGMPAVVHCKYSVGRCFENQGPHRSYFHTGGQSKKAKKAEKGGQRECKFEGSTAIQTETLHRGMAGCQNESSCRIFVFNVHEFKCL